MRRIAARDGGGAPGWVAALWLGAGCAAAPAPTRLWLAGDVHLGADGALGGPWAEAVRGPGFVNLEGPIGVGGAWAAPGQTRLGQHAGAPAALRAAGVRFVGLANNHRDDAGAAGRAATAAALAADGLVPVDRAWTGDGLHLVAAWAGEGAPAGLRAAVEAGPAGALRVVLLHVEGPAVYDPPAAAAPWVDAAVGAGARVVAVAGTHAVGPLEVRGGALVAWGLGDLAFDCDCSTGHEGLVLGVEAAGGARGPLAVELWGLRPGRGARPPAPLGDPAALFALLAGLGGAQPAARDGRFRLEVPAVDAAR